MKGKFFLGALLAIFCAQLSVALAAWALGVRPSNWLDRGALVGIFVLAGAVAVAGYALFWRAGGLSRSEDRQGGE